MMESVQDHLARAERRGQINDSRADLAAGLRKSIRRHRKQRRKDNREITIGSLWCLLMLAILTYVSYSKWGSTESYLLAAIAAALGTVIAVVVVLYVRASRDLKEQLDYLEQLVNEHEAS